MNKPSAVFFDIGDTLLAEVAYDLMAGVTALLQDPRMRSCREAESEENTVALDLVRDIKATHQIGHSEFSVANWIRSRADQEAKSEKNVAELERVLWEATVTLSPMPGARNALTMLSQDNTYLAAVSNAIFSQQLLASALDRHGLSSHLRFVLSSADIGHRKPSPIIFREAVSRANVAPDGIWFVGDTWEEDVLGAAQAGMLPIWMRTGGDHPHSSTTHIRIDNWSEFTRLWPTNRLVET